MLRDFNGFVRLERLTSEFLPKSPLELGGGDQELVFSQLAFIPEKSPFPMGTRQYFQSFQSSSVYQGKIIGLIVGMIPGNITLSISERFIYLHCFYA